MTEKIITPDVYSTENDRSYIAPGQSATGLAIIGPTQKGEAFIPTDVVSYGDFVAKFGADSNDTYVPQTVLNYLSAGTTAKVTRVLGNGGWKYSSGKSLAAIVKAASPAVIASPATTLLTTSSLLNAISGSGQTAIRLESDTTQYFYGFDPIPVLVSGSVVSDVKATSIIKFNATGGMNSNIVLTLVDPLSGSFSLASYYQTSSIASLSDIVSGVSSSISSNPYGYTLVATGSNSLQIIAPSDRGALINGTLISNSYISENRASASISISVDDANFNNITIYDISGNLYASRYTNGDTADNVGSWFETFINTNTNYSASYNSSTDILTLLSPRGGGSTNNGLSIYVKFSMISASSSNLYLDTVNILNGGVDGTYVETPAKVSLYNYLNLYKNNFISQTVVAKIIITDYNNNIVDILGDYTAVPADIDATIAGANLVNNINTLGNKGYNVTYNPSSNAFTVIFKPGYGASANWASTSASGYNCFVYYYTPNYTTNNGDTFKNGIDGSPELSVSITPFDNGVTGNTGSLVVIKGNSSTDSLGSIYFVNTGSNSTKLNNFVSTINSYQSLTGVTSSLSGSFIRMSTILPGASKNGYYAGNVSDLTVGSVTDANKFIFSGGQDESLASGGAILKVLHPSKNENIQLAHIGNSSLTGNADSFNLIISGSQINKSLDTSLNVTDNKYIGKILGSDASISENSAFLYLNFEKEFVNNNSNISVVTQQSDCSFTSSYQEGYDSAETPWILSDSGERLFKFIHKSHGFSTNRDIKVSITNISKNENTSIYNKFNVLVRKWNDTDKNLSILEQYVDVDLNPNSANYICRVIGTKYSEYDTNLGKVVQHGEYNNISNYIRVEVDNAVENATITHNSMINGHEAVFETIAGFDPVYKLPRVKYKSSNSGSYEYSGFDYSNSDNLNYLNPVPLEAVYGNNINFIKPSSDNKFTIPFQGGTDGMNYGTIKKIGSTISADGTNVFGFDLSYSGAAGASAYNKALSMLSNNKEYFFNLLVLPGIIDEYHSTVTALAESMVEFRSDAVYIRDLTGENTSIARATDLASGLDSSYSSAYYPWVKVRDLNSPKDNFVPPSVVVPQAYAYTDRVRAPWFAPAGVAVGILGGVIEAKVKLSKADTDILYAAKINPITKVVGTPGVAIMGQKTLQNATTALTRLNVRRLMIELRGYISNVAATLLFDQNTTAVRNNFLDKINPYLENVQQKEGIYGFKVVLDESNNPADVIDRNQLVCQIYIFPTKSIEYVLLEFNIEPTSGLTSFNNI